MGDSVAGGSIAGSFTSMNDAKSHSNSLTSKGTKKAKKRRVVKTEEELEEEKRMYESLYAINFTRMYVLTHTQTQILTPTTHAYRYFELPRKVHT